MPLQMSTALIVDLLHRNMEGYSEAGIEIRYLAYPRAGKESETYTNMVSAWCASDRRGRDYKT